MPKFPKIVWLKWNEDPNDKEDGGFWGFVFNADNAAEIGAEIKIGRYTLDGVETITTQVKRS